MPTSALAALRRFRPSQLCCGLFLALALRLPAEPAPLLLQHPAISAEAIAFSYGDDLWIVPRAGGAARRLATADGRLDGPHFSPDGKLIAFTGRINGNADVYVVPAAGGPLRRLTWHPGEDSALGWTPDGRSVLFASTRQTTRDLPQLYTIPVDGGAALRLPLPTGAYACFSPDGTHLAYMPYFQWQPDWKNYRGGQTTPLWIADLADSSIVKIPRQNSNDRYPMWVGDQIYFLSDRDGRFTLYAADAHGGPVRRLLEPGGFDIKSASAGAGVIVYDQLDALHVFDPATGRDAVVPVQITADLPRRTPRYEKVTGEMVQNAAVSPNGKRALFEVHGEILSVPAKKGDVRNLTQSPGSADRDPAWSPDGKWIAYLSDEAGEYGLAVRAPDGQEPARRIDLGTPGSFFYAPLWSPDSTKIAYTDKRLNLWFVSLDGKTRTKVDTNRFEGSLDPAWSPDSQWLAYVKVLPNFYHAVYVYSVATGQARQVTDGLSDAGSPRFDQSGKYLYFTASTKGALALDGSDMQSNERPVVGNVYAAVLRKDLPSPVAPESDEETPGTPDKKDGEAKAAEAKAPAPVTPVTIDFDGLDQRIVALPLPEANYATLVPGKEGVLFVAQAESYLPVEQAASEQPPTLELSRFDLKERKPVKLTDGVGRFSLSANGEKLLYEKDKAWFLTDADKEIKAGDGALKIDEMEVYVDPMAEWRQVYAEAWRIERDFFYDAHFHGLDLPAAQKLYAAFLPGLASRDDLNVLMREMTGWLVAGHVFVGGGNPPPAHPVATGLLGADYTVEDGRVRLARIYAGENWNADLQSPLTQPGIHAAVGEYVLAVNGREVTATDEFYRFFEQTAGKQTALRLAPKPNGKGVHTETVVPLGSEGNLRYKAWIEGNRRRVDELSGGRLAYLHLPDTHAGGYRNFNRYFFAQVDKAGAVVDERFNHGGQIADYIIDLLHRPVTMLAETREGERTMLPAQTIRGPIVMIINEMSGSGGDAMPWLFRTKGIGPLVGTRTWGGLIGIGGYPPFIDGGSITAPRWALYGTHGEWNAENKGIPPDIEVEQDPKLVRQGHDPQLEKAVETALALLAKTPLTEYPAPPYPDYHQKLPAQP